jgi:hypothetical protein
LNNGHRFIGVESSNSFKHCVYESSIILSLFDINGFLRSLDKGKILEALDYCLIVLAEYPKMGMFNIFKYESQIAFTISL